MTPVGEFVTPIPDDAKSEPQSTTEFESATELEAPQSTTPLVPLIKTPRDTPLQSVPKTCPENMETTPLCPLLNYESRMRRGTVIMTPGEEPSDWESAK